MDTISLLVYRHVHAAGPWIVLIGLVLSGLAILGIASLGLDVQLPQPGGDRLLAPWRWHSIASNLA